MWMSRTIDKVDKTMADIQEQTQLAAEIQDQISTGPLGVDIDEVRYFLVVALLCWNDHSSFVGRTEQGVGGSRTREAERYVAGRGTCTNTLTTRGYEENRGWVNRNARRGHEVYYFCRRVPGAGRGDNAEELTGRACHVTSFSELLFSYLFCSRRTTRLSFPTLI